MKKSLVVLAIVLSIAAMTAQPGCCTVKGVDPGMKDVSGVLRADDAGLLPYALADFAPQQAASFLFAKEIDLRDVDWGKTQEAERVEGAKSTVVVAENDDGDEEQEGGDEQEEDTAGWDRMWDAPKLG